MYVPYAFVLFFLGIYTVGDCFLSIATLEYWIYHRGAWFVSTIICLYLIFPFLYQLLNGRRRFLYAVSFVVIIMILIKIPVGEQVNTNILYNFQVAMSRVPCFILGMTVGKESKERYTMSILWFVPTIVLWILIGWKSLTLQYGRSWLIVMPICYVFIGILRRILNFQWLYKMLSWLGSISLESYLTNITVNSLISAIVTSCMVIPFHNATHVQYLIVVVLGLLLANIIHNYSQKINNLL